MENFSWDDINAAMSRDGAGQTQDEEPQEPQAQPEEQAQPQGQASAPAAPTNFWANLNDALANHEEHRFGVNMDAITDEAIMRRTEERRGRDAQKRLERLSRPVEGLSDEERYKALQERERRIAAYHQVQRKQRGERMPEPEPKRGIWDKANEALRMMQEDRRRTESALQAVRGLQEGVQPEGDASRVDLTARLNDLDEEHITRDENGNATSIYGRKIRTFLYPGEEKVFREQPEVAGMAAEDGTIILNPYSNIPKENYMLVAKDEAVRHYLHEMGDAAPVFELTPKQREYFSTMNHGKAYSPNKRDIMDTILARIITGDTSAMDFSPEQEAAARKVVASMRASHKPVRSRWFTWEMGDGNAETLPEGETNEWGGNLRNEGRKPLFRRDESGKINGYSTTSSTIVQDDDGSYVVIPTVVHGRELSPKDAERHYRETDMYWGKADNLEDAQKMAEAVHAKGMKLNQKQWNDYIQSHWDQMSDEIRNDPGLAEEQKHYGMLGYNPDNPQDVKPTGQMAREAEARDEAAMNDELERMRINDPEGYAQMEREVAAEEMKRRRDALPGIVKAPLYAVDLWDSAVGGLAGGAVTIAEGAGNIVGGIGRMFGSDSVGRAGSGVREWAKGAREAIEEGVPTDLYDTSGGGVVNSLLETGKNIAHVSGEFAPAMIPLVGQAYAGALIGAGATNAAADTYEVARATGLSKGQSARLALLKGELDGLVNMLLMGKFKGVWGRTAKGASDGTFMLKEANKYVNELFKRNGLQKLLDAGKAAGRKAMGELPEVGKVGGLMGASGVANKMIDETATGQFSEPESIVGTGIASFVEFGLFHLMNKAARNITSKIAKEIKFDGLAQSLNGEFARKLLRDWQARAMIYGNNQPEAIQAIISARQAGMDVTPEMLRKVGIPRQVAPSVRDCNAIADVFASDYRVWNEWVEEAYPSKERERQVGLAREIRSGQEMNAAAKEKERAANEGGMLSADEAREQQRELNDAAERNNAEQTARELKRTPITTNNEQLAREEAYPRKENGARQEGQNETGNGADEAPAPARPEQGARELQGGEAKEPVEGATARGEAPREGVVGKSAESTSEKISLTAMEKPAEAAETVKETPETEASLTTPAQPAENGPTTAPKPTEAQTPAKPAEGVETPSRPSDATPERKAPASATSEPVFENEQLETAYRMIQGGVEKDVKAGESLALEAVKKMKGRDLDRLLAMQGKKGFPDDESTRAIMEIAESERGSRWISDEPIDPDGPTPDPVAESAKAASRSRTSDATPAVSAPDRANDAQKMAYARIGGMQGVTITSAKMGKDGKVRMKYTRQATNGGQPTEYDCTIGKDGLTSTSVLGGKPTKATPTPAVQTGEVTSPETPASAAAPTTQPQTNKPNKESPPNPAPRSNRLRRRDGTDPIAEREAAKDGKTETLPATEPPAAKTEPKTETKPPAAKTDEKHVPMTPRAKRNRIAEVQKILANRPKDLPLMPEAFMAHASDETYANGRKKTVGLDLQKLRELHNDKTWHNELGLAPEEAQRVRDAIEEAYKIRSATAPNAKVNKTSEAGRFNYSVKAGNALKELKNNPDSVEALAKAQLYAKRALENEEASSAQSDNKQNRDFWRDQLAKIDERVAKLNDADAKKFVQAIRTEEAKATLESSNESGGTALNVAENELSHNPANGGSVKFSTFEARMNEKGEIVISRDRDVKDEFGHDRTKKTEVAISEEKFRAMAKQFGANPDKLLAEMRGKGGVDLRASKSDAADLPDTWTPESRKPLERVAQTLRNVVTVGGKKIKVLFVPRPKNADGNTRKSIGGVFTGAAADYANRSRQGGVDDGPSLRKIGTGEGSQVYGWGLYGSTERGVAEGYARADRDRKRGRRTTLKSDVLLDGKPIRDNYDALETHGGAIGMLEDYGSVDAVLKNYEFFENHGKLRAGERADYEWLKANRDRIALREVGDVPQHLYEQTFFTDRAPGDESHLLKWYEPVSKEQLKWIRDALVKEKNIRDYSKTGYGNVLVAFEHYLNVYSLEGDTRGITGETVYKAIDNVVDKDPQAASEFLYRAGIDGVKYPVDSYGGKGVKDGDKAGWNYVAFSDEHIRVDHKWTDGNLRYMKNAEGVTVGEYDAAKGEIRLYPGAKVADVVHEFTHPLVDFARAEAKAGRPELLNKIKEIIDAERKTWEQPVRDAYKGKGEGEILEEIFTHAMGARGADLFGKSTKTLQGRRWYNRLWEAIKGVWRDFATKMGWNRADLRGIEKMSPEDAAQKILSEMAKGRNFGDAVTGGEETRNAFAGRKGVSAAEDATYMDAVNRGDTETAQRMVREAAEHAGYRSVGFHGTSYKHGKFTKFNKGSHVGSEVYQALNRIGVEIDGPMEKEQIDLVVDNLRKSGKDVLSLIVKLDNPLRISDFGEDWSGRDFVRRLHNEHPELFTSAEWAEMVKDPSRAHEMIEGKGYDGLVYDNGSEGILDYSGNAPGRYRTDGTYVPNDAYIPFHPSQIKSADPVTYDDAGNVIPLSQRFNPQNEDIRYSRRVTPPPAPTTKDIADWLDGKDDVRRKWRRALQDKNIVPAPPPSPKIDMSKDESPKETYLRNMSDRYDPLKRLVEEARKGVADPDSVPDPYYEKRVQPGHNEADHHQIEMFKKRYRDFLERHSRNQKEQEQLHSDVNMYLRARDALYRNPEMKRRLGVDNGSGMSDAQARQILDDFYRRMRTPILAKAFKIMQDIKATYGLQRLVDGGMLDQATATMLQLRNPDYAPQRTNRLDEDGIDRNSTRSVDAAAIKKALGRSTLSDNPVEFLFLQAYDAAARTNENRVRQEMAKFVRMFPEVGTVRTVDKTSAYDFKTGKKAWVEDPYDRESDNPLVVSFRENGKRMRIEFADTPRGRRIAEAMRSEGVRRGPEFFNRFTRRWASTATQLSLTFSGRNALKDTAEVALNSSADTGVTGAGKFLKAQVAQLKPVVSTIHRYLVSGKFDGPLGKEFKEFVDAGASIGGIGREGYEDLNDTFARKAKSLRMAFSGSHSLKEKATAITDAAFGKVEHLNKISELVTRFNNYRSRRAKGESVKDAVIGSREDSTDFNMYGQQRWLNDLYMFSNSMIGSSLRGTKQLTTKKNGRKLATAILAYGLVESAADILFHDDDETEETGLGGSKNLSERERSQTLFVRVGGKYYRLPVHGGPFSALKYTGGLLARAMLGRLSWGDAAKNAAKEWATLGTHFGGAGEIDLTNDWKGLLNSATPSVLRPAAELGVNMNFAGNHIYMPKGFNKTTPRSEQGFESTGGGYKWFARLLNRIGGGNEHRRADWSWFDNPPEVYKHIAESIGKNLWRDIASFAETGVRAVESAWNWENRFTRDDVPFLRDVTRTVPDNSRRYHEAIEDYERDKGEFKDASPERRAEMRKEKPYLIGDKKGKTVVDLQIERVKEYMHWERDEIKVGRQWVKRKTPPSEERKAEIRKQRLALQAKVLKRLGR